MQAESGEQLDEVAVAERVRRLESSRGGAQAREADGEMRFPAGAQQMVEVRGEGDGFVAPVPQTEEHADADAAEAGGVSAFRTSQAPVVIFFRTGGVQPRVGRAVVGFLVDDETFGTGPDEREVVGFFHRRDFDGESRDFGREGAEYFLEVAVGDEFRMFAGDKEDVAETLRGEVAGLGADLLRLKGDAQDGVLPGKSAVGAAVDAFVGKIERGEKADGFAEVAAGQGAGAHGHFLEPLVVGRRQVARQGGHVRGQRQTQRREDSGRIGRRDERCVHRKRIVYRVFRFCNCKTAPGSGNLVASWIAAKQK